MPKYDTEDIVDIKNRKKKTTRLTVYSACLTKTNTAITITPCVCFQR